MLQGRRRKQLFAKPGQLRNPIRLYRTRRTPDTTDGMRLALYLYASVFARSVNARGMYLEGKNDQSKMELVYHFVIRRNDTFIPQVRDVVLFNSNFYPIVDAMDVDQRHPFWVLSVIDGGPSEDYTDAEGATVGNRGDAPSGLFYTPSAG